MEPDSGAAPFDLVAAFAALAHPQRLEVLRLLMRHYPRRVAAGEIGAVLSLKPSTLSGYLAQLLDAGLITQERRATSLLYAAAPAGASALSGGWIGAICGGRAWPEGGTPPGARVRNVLFIGQGNSGPSLIAEALLRAGAGERCEVFSAGLSPRRTEADAAVAALLEAQGHDTTLLWPKPLTTWQGPESPRMDIIITLGDHAASRAPDVPGCPHRAAWRLPDAGEIGDLAADLQRRIEILARVDFATLTPLRLQAVLDRLAEPLAEPLSEAPVVAEAGPARLGSRKGAGA